VVIGAGGWWRGARLDGAAPGASARAGGLQAVAQLLDKKSACLQLAQRHVRRAEKGTPAPPPPPGRRKEARAGPPACGQICEWSRRDGLQHRPVRVRMVARGWTTRADDFGIKAAGRPAPSSTATTQQARSDRGTFTTGEERFGVRRRRIRRGGGNRGRPGLWQNAGRVGHPGQL